jgi:hypothetical protein
MLWLKSEFEQFRIAQVRPTEVDAPEGALSQVGSWHHALRAIVEAGGVKLRLGEFRKGEVASAEMVVA